VIELGATARLTTGVPFESVIVAVPVPLTPSITALAGAESATSKVSSGSDTASATTVTAIGWVSVPGVKVSVPALLA
jgi:hypothetical protein